MYEFLLLLFHFRRSGNNVATIQLRFANLNKDELIDLVEALEDDRAIGELVVGSSNITADKGKDKEQNYCDYFVWWLRLKGVWN